MINWQIFECPVCHEAFRYEARGKAKDTIRDLELKYGQEIRIVIECPHCPQGLVLFPSKGLAVIASDKVPIENEKAIVYDKTFTEEGVRQVEMLNYEGHTLRSTDNQKAKQKFSAALAIRKHDPMSWYNLGVCQLYEGDLSNAEQSFRHALRFEPGHVQAINNLGSAMIMQGRVAEADDLYTQGIKINPHNPKFYLGKANVCFARKDFNGAKEQLQSALREDPNYKPALIALEDLNKKKI
jgi:Flp pilus assembly protein TadD